MSNKKVVLVGFSGHGMVVADAAREQGLDLLFYTDKQPVRENPYNLTYLGFEADPEYKFWDQDYGYALAIGNNLVRRRTADTIFSRGKELVNVIHPRSSVSKWVKIGVGVLVNSNATVNAQVTIGDCCIINSGSIVEHECRIGDAVHIAPGAVLAGGVQVGDYTFIGANSVIKEGVKIGENVIIGAGSVILKDVADNYKIVGNPGKKL